MKLLLLTALLLAPALLFANTLQDKHPTGYTDTPLVPGTKWHVHDPDRPLPRVVTPGANNSAPSDAVVLFDGKSLDAWHKQGSNDAAAWKVEGGCAEVNGTGSIETKESFGDCQLHIEWATPAKVESDSQGRGNSGVFLMGLYEVQVLDSYENRTYADGQASALYGQFPPLVNACRRPGEWQTYDIIFRAPRFENGKLAKPARVTVLQNGILTQDAQELLGATMHRVAPEYTEHAAELPLALQDHGNPERYRNIWIRKL
ncbi:MAG: DUF1080 domain-containing protein [Planctomycetes bacterium]|nr:DUF1080 domain-containing protein [Planctomycetota bacterium]